MPYLFYSSILKFQSMKVEWINKPQVLIHDTIQNEQHQQRQFPISNAVQCTPAYECYRKKRKYLLFIGYEKHQAPLHLLTFMRRAFFGLIARV